VTDAVVKAKAIDAKRRQVRDGSHSPVQQSNPLSIPLSSTALWAASHTTAGAPPSTLSGDAGSIVASSVDPSESASQTGSLSRHPSAQGLGVGEPPAKRRRSGRRAGDRPASSAGHTFQWTDALQARFETLLARITASAGFPLSWVENPEVEGLFQEFLPGAKLPSRGTLTRRIIPATLSHMRTSSHQQLEGLSGTLQCDGWTGINFVHIIAFMLTVEKRVCCIFFGYFRSTDWI
jgi:hypothetical protein